MIMISQYEAINSKNCTKIQTIDIFDLGRGALPNIFFLFFFEKRGGKGMPDTFFHKPPTTLCSK